MLQCCFFKALRISYFALRVCGYADKACHAFCKLHELAARQPLLSWTATSLAASPPAALSLARLRVARAAAKTWRSTAIISLRHVSPCVAAASHKANAQADNIGRPRPDASVRAPGLSTLAPLARRLAPRWTANRSISFAAPSGTHLSPFHYLQPLPTAQLKAVLPN